LAATTANMYCARKDTMFTTFIPAVHNFYLDNHVAKVKPPADTQMWPVALYTADLSLLQTVLSTSTGRLKNIAYTQNEILCCLSQQIEIGVSGDCDISLVSIATPEVRLL